MCIRSCAHNLRFDITSNFELNALTTYLIHYQHILIIPFELREIPTISHYSTDSSTRTQDGKGKNHVDGRKRDRQLPMHHEKDKKGSAFLSPSFTPLSTSNGTLCLSVSLCLSLFLSVSLLSLSLSLSLPVSVSLSPCLFLCPSLCLYLSLSVSLAVSVSVSLSFRR